MFGFDVHPLHLSARRIEEADGAAADRQVALARDEEGAAAVFEMFRLEVRPEPLRGRIERGQSGIQRRHQPSRIGRVKWFGGDGQTQIVHSNRMPENPLSYSQGMREVPTPAWITSQQLSGPTYLVNQYSAKGALALPGLLFVAAAVAVLVTGRPDMFVGILVIGAVVTAATAYSVSHFRFLASETWLAAEYVMVNRIVRLDDLVKASVTSGSYTHLTLRDGHGGSIKIQVSATLPHVRLQVVRAIMQGLQRGLHLDERTARTLGLKIQRL